MSVVVDLAINHQCNIVCSMTGGIQNYVARFAVQICGISFGVINEFAAR